MNQFHISFRELLDLLEPSGLVEDFGCPTPVYDRDCTHLSFNSQDVQPGTLFLCKGENFREQYLRDALAAGATAYLAVCRYPVDPQVPFVVVKDIRKAMSLVAIRFYRQAYQHFTLVGLTGTKGKTTTSYFMKNILDAHCRRCGQPESAILSTVEVYTGVEHHDAHLTTPESPDLQRYFAQTWASKIPYLTMEVSSQAYKMDRVYGMEFDLGIFLNIGEDHIGPMEHTDFEDYLSCKLQFIRHCRTAVLNREMDHFHRVLATARQHCARVLTFGSADSWDPQNPDSYCVQDIRREEGHGFAFAVCTGEHRREYRIGMPGRFNVENAVAAVVSAQALSVPEEAIEEGLLRNRVQGRMNLFERDGVTVLVDYAHNYLSFSKLYASLKADYPGRRIVALFGCPGGKAQLRRRDLGTLSGQNADYIYLTAEDPQFEDVNAICREIASYIEPYGTPYQIIPDRTQAIETAIANAKPGDIVLLAAKGEEVYQKVRGEYLPFESDLAIAKRCLQL